MAAITDKSKAELVKYARGMQSRFSKMKEKSAKISEEILATGIEAGATYGVVYADILYDNTDGKGHKLLGMPLPLLVAGIGIGAGVTGVAGNASAYAMALGKGGLCAMAARSAIGAAEAKKRAA